MSEFIEQASPARPGKRPAPEGPGTLSHQIRETLKSWEVTSQRIADLSGLNQSVVAKFLAGESGLTTASLDRIGKAFKVRISFAAPPSLESRSSKKKTKRKPAKKVSVAKPE